MDGVLLPIKMMVHILFYKNPKFITLMKKNREKKKKILEDLYLRAPCPVLVGQTAFLYFE